MWGSPACTVSWFGKKKKKKKNKKKIKTLEFPQESWPIFGGTTWRDSWQRVKLKNQNLMLLYYWGGNLGLEIDEGLKAGNWNSFGVL